MQERKSRQENRNQLQARQGAVGSVQQIGRSVFPRLSRVQQRRQLSRQGSSRERARLCVESQVPHRQYCTVQFCTVLSTTVTFLFFSFSSAYSTSTQASKQAELGLEDAVRQKTHALVDRVSLCLNRAVWSTAHRDPSPSPSPGPSPSPRQRQRQR